MRCPHCGKPMIRVGGVPVHEASKSTDCWAKAKAAQGKSA